MIHFGSRLRDLRRQKNLTQKQLAELVGVQNSIISFYEVGERVPSVEMIIRLSRVLRVSTDYLLGVEQGETVSVAGLSEVDKGLIRALIYRLGEQGQQK